MKTRALILPVLAACGGTLAESTDAGDAGRTTMTFAVYQIFLGDTDRSFDTSVTAWESYGRDVDGLVTTSSSNDVCSLAPGAPIATQVDGLNGIDNAWGSVIVPIMESVASLPTQSVAATQSIDAFGATFLVQVVGLDHTSTQTASGLTAQVFMGAAQQDAGTPAFDTSTNWPVASKSLDDGETIASGARAQFATASVTKGAFDSGASDGVIVWDLDYTGAPLPLVIHDPVVTFEHVGDDAVNGTISGVLDAQELIDALQAVAGQISQSLCGAFDGIASQIRAAQDILANGTNHAGTPCTGISIGLGFAAKRIANPTTVVHVVAAANPCP